MFLCNICGCNKVTQMEENINFDLVIKSFLNSALCALGGFKPNSRKEMNCLADATICTRHLAKEQNKYTDWNTLFDNVNNLISISAGNRYCNRVYLTMNQVFGRIAQYYKAPENFFKQQRLLESVRKYWVAVKHGIVGKVMYQLMSKERLVKKISR